MYTLNSILINLLHFYFTYSIVIFEFEFVPFCPNQVYDMKIQNQSTGSLIMLVGLMQVNAPNFINKGLAVTTQRNTDITNGWIFSGNTSESFSSIVKLLLSRSSLIEFSPITAACMCVAECLHICPSSVVCVCGFWVSGGRYLECVYRNIPQVNPQSGREREKMRELERDRGEIYWSGSVK